MSKNLTIDGYIEAVEKSLQYWLDLHTNPETWANEWACDEPQYMFKESPVISNDFFSFDWKDAALKEWCKENLNLFIHCVNCGMIFEDGYEDECCDNPEYDDCPEDELYSWMDELGTDGLTLSDGVLIDALINYGFPVYREALAPVTAGVEEEINDVLEALHNAETNEDRLQAVLWGTRVYHVNGNIMSDYGNRVNYALDYKLVDSIRNGGLESVFTREEIREFIKEG